jgi:hypothetical protein
MFAGKRVSYRTYADVRAVFAQDAKDAAGKTLHKAGELDWAGVGLDGGLVPLLFNADVSQSVNQWLNTTYFRQAETSVLVYQNSLLGSIASDKRFVYVLDHIAVPAPDFFQLIWNRDRTPTKVRDLVYGSTLVAFEIENGKQFWQLGGRLSLGKTDAFANCHFLGPPLRTNEKLYLLVEKNPGQKRDEEFLKTPAPEYDADLLLACVDPMKKDVEHRPLVLSVLPLGRIPQRLRITHDLTRHLNAVHLVQGAGIVVCPTHAGKILGVDVEKNKLAWTYTYAEPEAKKKEIKKVFKEIKNAVPAPEIRFAPEWKTAGTFLAGKKLVFAAPDDGWVRCLDITDGKLLWKAPRQDGVYLAGIFGDRAVIVGKQTCRAIRLSDGKELWSVASAAPSGRGVVRDSVFLVPVWRRTTGAPAGPGVCLIALDSGRLIGEVATADVLGNLVIRRDILLSQSATQIAAYRLR